MAWDGNRTNIQAIQTDSKNETFTIKWSDYDNAQYCITFYSCYEYAGS